MLWAELVVAVGGDEEGCRLVEPSAEEAEQVDRCAVRPVDVLEDGDRRPGAEGLERGGEELALGGIGVEPKLAGDVEQGSEGLRREEPVARAPENAGSLRVLVGERADEGGLADPGLAADEDQPSVAARSGGEMFAESGEIGTALDEFHAEMLTRCVIARYYALHGTCPDTQVPLAAAARHGRVLRAGSSS